ncbi:hypothetical protein J4457_01495 [Candidatus Woesearchaeota archaeon]|nr:hypothetical protein [Candidatus Woesearchaeota archaeon]
MLRGFRHYLLSLLMRSKKLAHVTEKEVRKEIDYMVKSKVISGREAAALLKLVMDEIKCEKEHFKALAKKELYRGVNRGRPFVRKVLSKGKKVAKSVASRAKRRVSRVLRR